jgi:uncharacterized protein (TIGR00297 family)
MKHSESARQWVHIGSGFFALLLRVMTWWQAAALAAFALAFNATILPRIGGQKLYRPVDEARGFPLGILLYPLSVLLLVLIFPSRLDIVAIAWIILALGDGFSTLVGASVGGTPLPWNRHKTVAGTVAFVFFGGLGATGLAWWMSAPSIVVAPLAATVAAGLIETIPIRLDDNISVPATAAAILWIAGMVSTPSLVASRDVVFAALPWAIGVNLLVAVLGYRLGTVTMAGALGGVLVGMVIFSGAGSGGWLLLFATFLAAAVTSRLGLERKTQLGIEEERGGRRGAGNALANCGVASIAAFMAVATPYRPEALLALVAALTAGGSDTVASEIGKAWGRAAFLVTSLGRVKPGTPGAMSLEGTAAGLVAAIGLATLAVGLGLMPTTSIPAVVVGATAGALVESALGATLEGPGILNNDMLNFINTAVASAVALAIA